MINPGHVPAVLGMNEDWFPLNLPHPDPDKMPFKLCVKELSICHTTET